MIGFSYNIERIYSVICTGNDILSLCNLHMRGMDLTKWLVSAILIFVVCAVLYPIDIIYAIDVNVTLFFERIRSPFLTEMFLFISDIGSIKYTLPLCIVVALILLIKRKMIDVVFLFCMYFGVRQINYQMKEFFVRERPPFDAVYEAAHYSFPSGHSMNSIAIFSFICYLVITHFVKSYNKNNYLLLFTFLLVFFIGLSRIYLGVHYLTDVLAGFSAGFVWFILIKIMLEKVNQLVAKKSDF